MKKYITKAEILRKVFQVIGRKQNEIAFRHAIDQFTLHEISTPSVNHMIGTTYSNGKSQLYCLEYLDSINYKKFVHILHEWHA